jgi:hypothetical protein
MTKKDIYEQIPTTRTGDRILRRRRRPRGLRNIISRGIRRVFKSPSSS